MKDHYFVCDETGHRIPIARLPTSLLHELLASPIVVHDGPSNAAEWVRERLRIELRIRELGWTW
jgi:hypothetical protein